MRGRQFKNQKTHDFIFKRNTLYCNGDKPFLRLVTLDARCAGRRVKLLRVDYGELSWSMLRSNSWPMIFSWWSAYRAVDGYHCMHILYSLYVPGNSALQSTPHYGNKVTHRLSALDSIQTDETDIGILTQHGVKYLSRSAKTIQCLIITWVTDNHITLRIYQCVYASSFIVSSLTNEKCFSAGAW